jgi:hypothetical protein
MFSHSIPATITNLTRLVHLNLASNSMSGVIPKNLSNLIGMKGGNSPTSFSSNILNMSVLTKGQELNYEDTIIFDMVIIDLSSNSLIGGIPDELFTLDGIFSLNLSWNKLVETSQTRLVTCSLWSHLTYQGTGFMEKSHKVYQICHP